MVMDVWPFRFYRPSNGSLNVSLIALDKYPCGFEYGYRDPARGVSTPFIYFRIGKLQVVYYEQNRNDDGSMFREVWLFGFWFMTPWSS